MKHSSFYLLTFTILFFIIFCSCFFIPFSKYYPEAFATNTSKDEKHGETINLSTTYTWPIPRLYKN